MAALLNACAMFGGGDDKDSPKPIDRFSDQAGEKTVPLKIFAGSNLNPDSNGQPLSVLVRFYILRDPNKFKEMGFDSFLSPGEARKELGDDLIKERETTIVPQQKYTTNVPLVPNGGYLGVVALFRNPAHGRWRVALDLTPKKAQAMTVGLSACAIAVTSGKLVGNDGDKFSRLGNVECPHPTQNNDAAADSSS